LELRPRPSMASSPYAPPEACAVEGGWGTNRWRDESAVSDARDGRDGWDGVAPRRVRSVVVSSRRRFVRTRSNDAGGGGRGGRARGTRHDSAGDGGRSKRFVIRSLRACSALGTAVSTTSATGDGVERATGETSVSSKRTSERRGRESDARDGTGRARTRRRGGRARPPRVSRRTVKVKRPRRDRRSARARRRVSARRSSDR
jgi:hypothetical protein